MTGIGPGKDWKRGVDVEPVETPAAAKKKAEAGAATGFTGVGAF
jgi:hypothetical protein